MSQKAKLLEKDKNNPKGLRLSEFETIMKQCEWIKDHQTGSHQIWFSPKGNRLTVQPRKDGMAKGYQVIQFLIRYEQEKN